MVQRDDYAWAKLFEQVAVDADDYGKFAREVRAELLAEIDAAMLEAYRNTPKEDVAARHAWKYAQEFIKMGFKP